MVTLLFVLCLEITLPGEILGISQLVKVDESLILLDNYSQSLWRLDPNGHSDLVYNRPGFGPGEYSKLFKVKSSGDQLILVDLLGRKFIFLDNQFKFQKEIKVQGLARDALVLDDELFLVYPSNKGMVHKYVNGIVNISFGSMINDTKLYGFESGQVLNDKDKIYYIHHFKPALEIYSSDGELEAITALPGFDDGPLVSLQKNGAITKQIYRYSLKDIFRKSNMIYLDLADYKDMKRWLYVYDVAKQRFLERQAKKAHFLWDGSRDFYEVEIGEHTDVISLKTYQFETNQRTD